MNEELSTANFRSDRCRRPAIRAETQRRRLALREKDSRRVAAHDLARIHSNARRFAIGLYALGFRPATGWRSRATTRRNGCTPISPRRWLGGACLGIYPTNPWPELQYIVRHSRAKIVVCGDQEQTDKVSMRAATTAACPISPT